MATVSGVCAETVLPAGLKSVGHRGGAAEPVCQPGRVKMLAAQPSPEPIRLGLQVGNVPAQEGTDSLLALDDGAEQLQLLLAIAVVLLAVGHGQSSPSRSARSAALGPSVL